MTLFLIFASVLVLITLAVLIASVWRESPQSDDEPGLVAKNIAIARESLAALDTAHAGGSDWNARCNRSILERCW